MGPPIEDPKRSHSFFYWISLFDPINSRFQLKIAQYHIGHIGSLDTIFYQWKFGLETANHPGKIEEYTMSEKEKTWYDSISRLS